MDSTLEFIRNNISVFDLVVVKTSSPKFFVICIAVVPIPLDPP